jgi:hypothetical protein
MAGKRLAKRLTKCMANAYVMPAHHHHLLLFHGGKGICLFINLFSTTEGVPA